MRPVEFDFFYICDCRLTISPDAELKDQLEDLTKDTSRLLGFARDGVKMLHKSRKGDKKLRMGQYNFVLQKLQAVTKSFLQVQNEIKLSKRDQIARQYKIARPNASEEEIQQGFCHT
ncbi:hypothetical protein HDU84_007276 [Entophlyctis sp. JEL0112]|nr:hypothetical protein HDU84_007276 [Entophlyctis sp. JEL0112]